MSGLCIRSDTPRKKAGEITSGTYCELNLAAPHDVVQEGIHFDDLQLEMRKDKIGSGRGGKEDAAADGPTSDSSELLMAVPPFLTPDFDRAPPQMQGNSQLGERREANLSPAETIGPPERTRPGAAFAHLTVVENDHAGVSVVLLLHLVLRVDALPLNLREQTYLLIQSGHLEKLSTNIQLNNNI